MYKPKLILALLVSTIYTAPSLAFAADSNAELQPINAGIPLGSIDEAKAPETSNVDGSPLVEEGTKPKLKSVKELFKSKNAEAAKESEKKPADTIKLSDQTSGDESNNVEVTPFAASDENLDSNSVDSNNSEDPKDKKAAAVAVEENPEDLPILGGMHENSENLNTTTQPDVPTDPNAPVDPNAKPADAKEKKPAFDPNIEGRSIMFNQISILRVMQVLSAYIESKSNQIPNDVQEQRKKSLEELQQELLAKLKPEEFVKGKKDIVTVKLPAYVKVDSILFRSPANKQVWINKTKFSEGDNNSEISVKAIEKEWAYIELSAKDTNVDLKKFKIILKRAKVQQPITIDEEKQIIAFRLSVNQYIDLAALKIKEGTFDTSKANLDNKSGHYYDPAKPGDRFVPLEEAEKAAEAAQSAAPATDSTLTTAPEAKGSNNFQAIDENEVEDNSTQPVEDERSQNESGIKKDPSDVSFKVEVDKSDPNYEKFQQSAKAALASGKVSATDKEAMESIANGSGTVEMPLKKQ